MGNKILVGSNFTQFKNRILNGDMQVAQRGKVFSIKNDDEFTADRWFSSTANDNEIEVRVENIYGLNEGSTINTLDIFGDGSCIATYTLDGNANDLSGNYNGTWSGAEAYANGKFGQGALKNDINEATSIGLSNDIVFNDESFSISCWIKLFDTNNKDNGLFLGSRDYNNTLSYIWINQWTNHIEITDNDENEYQLDYEYTTNTLIHLCIVSSKEYNKVSFFIDNVKIGEVSGYVASYTIDELLGCYADNYHKAFNGLIDQVRVFNRALTEDEVKKLYVEDYNYIYKKHLRTNLITKGTTYTVTPYEYRFEGQHMADILTAKKEAILSFELSSSVNKDYTVRMYYPDGTLYSEDTISYNGNKEFTKHSVLFDFKDIDLTKVNLDDNLGIVLTIGENDELNEGDYLRITNVQFEKGSVATEFEVLPYESQLDRCMRYYEKSVFHFGNDGSGDNSSFIWNYFFKQIKKSEPIIFVDNLKTYQTDTALTINHGEGISGNIDKKQQCLLRISPSVNDAYTEIAGDIKIDAELSGRGE